MSQRCRLIPGEFTAPPAGGVPPKAEFRQSHRWLTLHRRQMPLVFYSAATNCETLYRFFCRTYLAASIMYAAMPQCPLRR